MKILHTAMMKKFSLGIAEQMQSELNAAQELNASFTVKIFSPNQHINKGYCSLFHLISLNKTGKIFSWIEFRVKYYSWLLSQEDGVDCFLLRYSAYDPLQYFFIKKTKKPVYLIHHTKEHDELRSMGLIGNCYYLIDKIFGDMSIKSAKGIIGVTEEIIDYEKSRINDSEKPSILYPNGIEVLDTLLEDSRSNLIPEFIFVASYFYSWHGLDILLNEMENSKEKFVLHLVGEVSQEDLIYAKKDNRIVLHGKLNNLEIEELSSRCWLGLGSFALYRKKMTQGSTLKVREYLNNGLPVYSGHKDSFPNSFSFYKFDELNITSLIEFSKTVRKVSKQEVRSESTPYISKKNCLENLIRDLHTCLAE